MAQCKLCGTRYWFFSNHVCKPQPVTKKNYTYPKTSVSNVNSKQTIQRDSESSDANYSTQQHQIYAQQQLQQQAFLTSASDNTCRSEPMKPTVHNHHHESVSSSYSHHSSSSDSSSSYSSDSSSSSCDSGSSSSSGCD